MAQTRLYLAVQRLTLGDTNWDTLIAAMQAKGANQHPNPSHRNHWRLSIDETIWIFEAEFDTTVVDVDWFITWMSNQFGVPEGDIGESTGYNIYGRFSTFSYPGGVTNRFRLGVFGFVQGQGWPSYEESHAAVLQYLFDNISDWEAPLEALIPMVTVLGAEIPAYTTKLGKLIWDTITGKV